MKKFVLALAAVLSTPAFADAPKIWFENPGGVSRDVVTDGKTRIKPGFFGMFDVRDLVKGNPAALEATARQGRFNTYAHLTYWIGVIPAAAFMGWELGSEHDGLALLGAVGVLSMSFL